MFILIPLIRSLRKVLVKQKYLHKYLCTVHKFNSLIPWGYRRSLLRHYLPQFSGLVLLMGRNSGGCDNYFHPYITFNLHRFGGEPFTSECFAKVSFIEDKWIQYIFHLCRFGFVLRNTQNGMVCHGVNGAIFKLKWDTFWAIFGTL